MVNYLNLTYINFYSDATLLVFLNPAVPTEGASFSACVRIIPVPAELEVNVDLMISGDVDCKL